VKALAIAILLSALAQDKPKIDERKLYPFGADSERHDGVPKGTVTKWTWKSTVFAGTVRDCWTYVPAQYDKEKPAAVMVFQDGGGYQNETGAYRVPVVFDNLIHKKKMPVTIGIFVNPGVLEAKDPTTEQHRYNRTAAGSSLGLSLRQIRYRMARLGVNVGGDLAGAERD